MWIIPIGFSVISLESIGYQSSTDTGDFVLKYVMNWKIKFHFLQSCTETFKITLSLTNLQLLRRLTYNNQEPTGRMEWNGNGMKLPETAHSHCALMTSYTPSNHVTSRTPPLSLQRSVNQRLHGLQPRDLAKHFDWFMSRYAPNNIWNFKYVFMVNHVEFALET